MHVFGEINKSSTVVENNVVHYTHNLITSSLGIQSIKVVSGSISSSYWDSLNVLFYTSGSPKYVGEHKFAHPGRNLSVNDPFSTQFLTKFHGYPSQSIFTIPSTYYGEKIKEGSFKLTDTSKASSVVIKDDGFGNLYAVDNTVSHSTNNQSSSENYVGNIFYNQGLAVVTETSSYSHTPSIASVKYVNSSTPPGHDHFFITGSDLSTSIQFISTGSTETDTATIKFFGSGSSTANTAASGARKINDVFGGIHISASSVGNVITMSNSANLLTNRRPLNTTDNLPAISGAGAFTTSSGFSGGTAAINYSDIGTNYQIQLDSSNTITTYEYNVTLLPQEFNHSMNYTLRSPISGAGELKLSTPYLSKDFTGSLFHPYITTINLYQNGDLSEPIIQAKLNKPIKKSKKINTSFKIKLDI
tara:strand:- start:439 stop:1686 length:1248 start_codon:yes stop_codon:yes gene_type:complete